MLKRKSIILSVLVIIFLSCTQSMHNAGAEEKARPLHPGTTLEECKILKEDPKDPIYIKVIRNRNNLCAEEVWQHKTANCSDQVPKPVPVFDPEENPNPEKKPIPENAYAGTGNQFCPEAIVVFKNSPHCFQYTTGGRTYYIPPG